jgi:hypothetical protein
MQRENLSTSQFLKGIQFSFIQATEIEFNKTIDGEFYCGFYIGQVDTKNKYQGVGILYYHNDSQRGNIYVGTWN